MKKFKYLLIAIVALVVCSCGASVEELSEEVRKDIKAEYSKDYYNVVVGDFTLVHNDKNVGITDRAYSLSYYNFRTRRQIVFERVSDLCLGCRIYGTR